MHSWNADCTLFLIIEFRAAEPAAQKPGKFVAGDSVVIRMHLPNSLKAFITPHSIEESIHQCEYARFSASSLK